MPGSMRTTSAEKIWSLKIYGNGVYKNEFGALALKKYLCEENKAFISFWNSLKCMHVATLIRALWMGLSLQEMCSLCINRLGFMKIELNALEQRRDDVNPVLSGRGTTDQCRSEQAVFCEKESSSSGQMWELHRHHVVLNDRSHPRPNKEMCTHPRIHTW